MDCNYVKDTTGTKTEDENDYVIEKPRQRRPALEYVMCDIQNIWQFGSRHWVS